MKKLLLLAVAILCPHFLMAQGSLASFAVQTPTGDAIAGAHVALCTSTLPTLATPCGGSALQQTYSDITLGTPCTLNASTAGPLYGVGCTNPGLTDRHGMAHLYANTSPGISYYQVYGNPFPLTNIEPIFFPDSGGGSSVTFGGDLEANSSTSQEVIGILNKALPSAAAGCLNLSGSPLAWGFTSCSGGGGGVSGSGTTGYLPEWTGPTALGNSPIQDTGPFGALISSEPLHINPVTGYALTTTTIPTLCSGSESNFAHFPDCNSTYFSFGATTGTGGIQVANFGYLNGASYSGTGGLLAGNMGEGNCCNGGGAPLYTAGTVGWGYVPFSGVSSTNIAGVYGIGTNFGASLNLLMGGDFQIQVGANTTNSNGLRVRSPLISSGQTAAHVYGLYIEDQTIAGSGTNSDPWGIFEAGTAKNQLGGPLTVPNLTDSALTAGNCVQAGTGGILTTAASPCGSGGGSGNVLLAPTLSQNIVQPLVSGVTSSLTANNFSNIRYVTSTWNWAPQSPGGSLSIGSNTISLAPCPVGVDTASSSHFYTYTVYITGGSVGAEVVPVTGGSCTSGAASGTIIVTTVNARSGAWTVGPSSSGIQEAENDAFNGQTQGQFPSIALVADTTYSVYGTVYLRGYGSRMTGYGAYVSCYTRDRCIQMGGNNASPSYSGAKIYGLTGGSTLNVDGSQVSSVSASSGIYTVTTAGAHNFAVGDTVACETHSTTTDQFWVAKAIAPTSGTTLTASFGSLTFSAGNTFGFCNILNTFVEDNSDKGVMEDINLITATGTTGVFTYGIVGDNDQEASIVRFGNFGQTIIKNSSNWPMGALLYQRIDQGMAGIMFISDSELSNNNCYTGGNNGLSVTNSVCEGEPTYAFRYQGSLEPATWANVYFDAGSANPLYPVGTGAAHMLVEFSGGPGSKIVGNFPLISDPAVFITGGSTQRNYYVVPHSSTLGYGPLMFVGYGLPASGLTNVPVTWPNIDGLDGISRSVGTMTWDILVTIGPSTTTPPFDTGTYALQTGYSATCGTNGMCSYTDTQSATSSYTVQTPQFAPQFWFWPASLVNNTTGVAPMFMETYKGQPIVSARGGPGAGAANFGPAVIAQQCSSGTSAYFSPTWVTCLDVGGVNGALLMFQPTGQANNSKGRQNFGAANGTSDLITLVDSNIGKTLSQFAFRPSNDSGDMAIGVDQVNGLALRANVSISDYIGTLADNSSYLERLTASAQTFNVPVTVNGNETVTGTITVGGCSGCGVGSVYLLQVAGGTVFTAGDTVNFNATTPTAGSNGINVVFNTSKAGTTDSVSAYVQGDGNTAHFLRGDGTFANVTATTTTNLAGGASGSIPYQSAASTTAFLAGNTAATDQVLISHGTGGGDLPPTFSNAPALSAANMTSGSFSGLFGTPSIVVAGLTDTAMTGGPFCVQETSGVLTATASTCGSGGGGGSNVSVNGGSTIASPNLNATTPAAGANFLNCTWQQATNNVSVECPSGTTSSTFALGNAAITIAGTSVALGGSTSSLPSPGAIGGTTPGTAAFTTLSTTGQYTNTVTTGTAPFVVSSTTAVANLAIGGTAGGLSGTPSITVATLTATTIAGGALSGTFTGAPTMSGNIAFTGTPTFSNTLALNTTGTSGGLTGSPAVTVSSIIDSGISSSTDPICPNGAGGAFTTTGCSGGGGGSGTVSSGTQYQLGYYAANGTTISGNSNIVTDSSGDLTITGFLAASSLQITGPWLLVAPNYGSAPAAPGSGNGGQYIDANGNLNIAAGTGSWYAVPGIGTLSRYSIPMLSVTAASGITPQLANSVFSQNAGGTSATISSLTAGFVTSSSGGVLTNHAGSGNTTTAVTATSGVAGAAATIPLVADGSGNAEPWQTSTTVGLSGAYSFGQPAALLPSGTGTPVLNTMYVHKYFNTVPQTLGHAVAYTTTAGVATTFYVCVYTSTSSAAVWSGNAADTTTGAAVNISAAQYTLLPNTTYFIGYGQAGTTGAVMATYSTSAGSSLIVNVNGSRVTSAANGVSAGCPATTGTLTNSTAAAAQTMILLEP